MDFSTAVFYLSFCYLRFALPLVLACLIFNKFLEKRSKYALRLTISLVAYTALSLLVNYYESYIAIGWFHFYFIFIFMFAIALLFVCFKAPLMQIVFYATTAYCIQHIGDDIASVILHYVSDSIDIVNMLTYSFIQLIVLAIAFLMIVIRKSYTTTLKINNWYTMVIFIIAIASVYVFSMYRYYYEGVYEFTSYYYDFIVCVVILFVQFGLYERSNMLINEEVLKGVISQASLQEKASKEAINIINIKCHDLKKQLRTLSQIEDPSSRKSMLADLNKAINIYESSFHTGNETLDVVLTEKSLICNNYGMQLMVLADGITLNFMDNSDIYSLFSNALDNAIEALQYKSQEKRIINIKVGKELNFVIIKIENYCSAQVDFKKDGTLKSTKGNEYYHGFGTKSIKYIAEKYHGKCKFEISDNTFIVKITFLMNK